MGLSIPLCHFSYSFSRLGKISINFNPERNDQAENWQFWQIHPNNKHKVAMAVKDKKSFTISMRNIIPLLGIDTVNYPISHQSLAPSYIVEGII